jgi:enoyl-CoA hydratase
MTEPFGSFETLSVASTERVITITIDRPLKLNAINAATVDDLHRLLSILERDHGESVLIIQGAGDKAFVAGADIAELLDRGAGEARQGININIFNRLAAFPFVTIAKIDGYCIGGGLELALACDIRVATPESLFSQPEVSMGIIPAAGGTFRLPDLVGPGFAREMVFSGLRLNGREALARGLVNHAVEKEALDDTVATITKRILKQGIEAVLVAKRVMNIDHMPYRGEAATLAQMRLFDSADKQKRMQDFLAK